VNALKPLTALVNRFRAGWTRPTTGRLSGEFIDDAHVYPPAGGVQGDNYAQRIGLYDPEKGHRPLSSGREFVQLEIGSPAG
jgi:hypothetical protein